MNGKNKPNRHVYSVLQALYLQLSMDDPSISRTDFAAMVMEELARGIKIAEDKINPIQVTYSFRITEEITPEMIQKTEEELG